MQTTSLLLLLLASIIVAQAESNLCTDIIDCASCTSRNDCQWCSVEGKCKSLSNTTCAQPYVYNEQCVDATLSACQSKSSSCNDCVADLNCLYITDGYLSIQQADGSPEIIKLKNATCWRATPIIGTNYYAQVHKGNKVVIDVVAEKSFYMQCVVRGTTLEKKCNIFRNYLLVDWRWILVFIGIDSDTVLYLLLLLLLLLQLLQEAHRLYANQLVIFVLIRFIFVITIIFAMIRCFIFF